MEEEKDHRADDPIVQEAMHQSSEPQEVTETVYKRFDDAPNREAQAKYGKDAQDAKTDKWRRQQGRKASYKRNKTKKTPQKEKLRRSLRSSDWGSFLHGEKKKKQKKGEGDSMDLLSLAPLGMLGAVLGLIAYTIVKK